MGRNRLRIESEIGCVNGVTPPVASFALLTTPVGMVLYVLSKVTHVPFERCVTATAPFLIPLLVVLVLLTFVPELSMWLPQRIYR